MTVINARQVMSRILDDSDRAPLFVPRLWIQRRMMASNILKDFQVKRVLDLGCGQGALLEMLLNDTEFLSLAGLDIDIEALELGKRNCSPSEYNTRFLREQPIELNLFHGSFECIDQRLAGYEAIVSLEVIEHLHPQQLEAFPRVVFGIYQPRLVIISTPNAEFNIHFPGLAYGTPNQKFRHDDHKFEWTRPEFQQWCESIVQLYPYQVIYVGCGISKTGPDVGPCTQMAIFLRNPEISPQPMNLSVDQVQNVYQLEMPYLQQAATQTEITELLMEQVKFQFQHAEHGIFRVADIWSHLTVRHMCWTPTRLLEYLHLMQDNGGFFVEQAPLTVMHAWYPFLTQRPIKLEEFYLKKRM